MTVKLKRGFFKVAPIKPYVPLTTTYYGYEADNVFEIRKLGGTTVSSYYASSHGMGKVLSLFNKEFFLFHNGASQIMVIAPDDTVSALMTITGVTDASVVTMENNFMVITKNGTDITVSSYVIAGAPEDFWAELVDTKTIAATGSVGPLFACRASDTDSYVCTRSSGGSLSTLRVVSTPTFSPSAALNWVSGGIADMQIPVAGNLLTYAPGSRYYWSKEYNYYVVKSGDTFSLYHKSGTLIWSGTFATPGVNFYIDQSTGNGYVMTGEVQDVQNQHFLTKLYSLQSGTLSLITTSGYGNLTAHQFCGNNYIVPLIDNTFTPMSQYQQTGNKATPSTTSITMTSATNVGFSAFASAIRFA